VLVGEDGGGVLEEEFYDLEVAISGGQTQRRVLFSEGQIENPTVDDAPRHIDKATRTRVCHGFLDRVRSFGLDALLDDWGVVVVNCARELRGHFIHSEVIRVEKYV